MPATNASHPTTGPVAPRHLRRPLSRPGSRRGRHLAQRGQRGFTMIEAAVAIAILGLVTAIVASVVINSLQASAEVHVTTEGSHSAERAAEECARDLMEDATFTVFPSNFDIDWQEPVDHDGDGDFFDDGGVMEYGAAGQLGWRYQFCYTQTGTLSESANALDLNRDGDLTDTFRLGQIFLRTYDENGAEQGTPSRVPGGDQCLQPAAGTTDPAIPPIFSIPFENGAEIAVTKLRLVQIGRTRVPRLFIGRRVVSQR